MAFKFPFTNYHELNLDWILKKLEELFNASAENVETIETYEGRLSIVEGEVVTIGGNAEQALQIATAAQADVVQAQQTATQALGLAQTAQSTAAGAINATGIAIQESQLARQEAEQAIYIAQNTAGQLDGQIAALQAESERQIQAIEDKGDEVIASIPSDYTDLQDALNSIIERNQIVLQKANINSTYDSTYVNEGYIGSNGGFVANSGYRTFYYQVAESTGIYIEGIGVPDMYLSLAVYNTSVSTGNFIARYRLQDGNLPTSSNKLSVTAGQWLVISYGYSTQEERDFKLYTGVYRYTNIPTDAFIENINKNEFVGKVTKTTTSIVVYIGKAKYEINKYNNSAIRAYLWRTNACRILDGDGVYQTVWENSDSDGVVKIRGEGDFIGGYHGDETETLFKLFIDGVEYSEDSTFENKTFNEIIMYFESNVFHCNTSETPDVIAFKRNKLIRFNKDGYSVENYWTAQENLICEVSYIGMLSVENNLINGYSTNADYKYHALDSGTESSKDMTEVIFNTPYGDIRMVVSNPVPSEHYNCSVAAFTGRMKVYAAPFSSSAYGSLNQGDIIKGKATINT